MNAHKKITSFVLLTFILSLIGLPFIPAQSAYGPPIVKESYEISRSKIEREIAQGNIFTDSLSIKNLGSSNLRTAVSLSGSGISEVIDLDSTGVIIEANNATEVFFTITGKEVNSYSGEVVISGDVDERIPISITVVNESVGSDFFLTVETRKSRFTFKEQLDFDVDVKKLLGSEEIRNVSFSFFIKDQENNVSYFLSNETKDIIGSFQIRKKFDLPENIEKGFYVLEVSANHNNRTVIGKDEFRVVVPFFSILLFGFLPMWLLFVILGLLILLLVAFILIARIIKKRKKYKMQLYTNTLPKKTDRSLWLGKVAETKKTAYLDMDALTTHGVVAGATGGGKSISAQVIIEEALLNDVAVIVFDPTAQWSGMLRKNEDKKMLSFYSKFGLKPKDAKAFKGNVRQIQNERQAIDINKYMNPGQIQIFTMNKLTPPQIDTFVATVIASIFKSDPKEHPNLRMMLVFDEVHRLLPKFGGSGKGFLQIERACREFRKWGFGVMLVSQVLSDFVGEIKANINTEVQMRTRDEGDLNRLKTKYGEEFLQSLIKASVGVGMFVNPRYNKGKPYFINFRPILHSTRRLSDAILEKYNKYSEIIEDIEYQIEQLEKEKVDVFDLKMELKLVKEKLMTGNFTVVEIYLEGLTPRLEKQWQTLGKKPKKLEIKLVEATEVEASLNKAQKERKKWDKKEGDKDGEKNQEDTEDSKSEEGEKDDAEEKEEVKSDEKKETKDDKESEKKEEIKKEKPKSEKAEPKEKVKKEKSVVKKVKDEKKK